jgi:hypothetical protein
MIKKNPVYIEDIEDYIVGLMENGIMPKKFILSKQEFDYLADFFKHNKTKRPVFSTNGAAVRATMAGVTVVFLSESYKKQHTIH